MDPIQKITYKFDKTQKTKKKLSFFYKQILSFKTEKFHIKMMKSRYQQMFIQIKSSWLSAGGVGWVYLVERKKSQPHT